MAELTEEEKKKLFFSSLAELEKDGDELKPRQRNFLFMLESCMGIVSTACEKFKVARVTHYDWMQTNLTYKKAVDLINERNIDFAESKLLTHIKNDDIASLLFYLKCKGKKRGYVERQEVMAEVNKVELKKPVWFTELVNHEENTK